MRCVIALLTAVVLLAPASAAAPPAGEIVSAEAALRWINGYRSNPDVGRVPAVIRTLSRLGAFKDPEASGAYVGFLAGVIGANPRRADEVIAKLFPIAPEDHWVVIKAIAYSGLSDWKGLMTRFADRMSTRKVMIDKYVNGQLPTLNEVPIEGKAPGSFWDKLRVDKYFTRKSSAREYKIAFDTNPELLDTLWGYYFATGDQSPILRMIGMLPWANERNSVEKLTIGSMAKFTLASNASHDAELLDLLKSAAKHQPKNVLPILNEVIEAADVVETSRLRKEAANAIEELKRKGPGYKRDMAWWGQVGEGAIGAGCLTAAVLGQIEVGVPCVVGGALSSAAVHYWAQP